MRIRAPHGFVWTAVRHSRPSRLRRRTPRSRLVRVDIGSIGCWARAPVRSSMRQRTARLGREVAVAVIKSDGLDDAGRHRIEREARAMARLGDHPNIVTVFDVGEDDGRAVHRFGADAGRFGSRCRSPAHEDQRLRDRRRVARSPSRSRSRFAHAHGHGVVHRDLKPANVWIAADGTARLGDFGLAVEADRSRITSEGMVVGTVAYLAPEQAVGRAPDARSDLYALGASLYEMFTGRPPFLGDDAVDGDLAAPEHRAGRAVVAQRRRDRRRSKRSCFACWRRTRQRARRRRRGRRGAPAPARARRPESSMRRGGGDGRPAVRAGGVRSVRRSRHGAREADGDASTKPLSGRTPTGDASSASRASARRASRRSWRLRGGSRRAGVLGALLRGRARRAVSAVRRGAARLRA